jgi:hypothetical protein
MTVTILVRLSLALWLSFPPSTILPALQSQYEMAISNKTIIALALLAVAVAVVAETQGTCNVKLDTSTCLQCHVGSFGNGQRRRPSPGPLRADGPLPCSLPSLPLHSKRTRAAGVPVRTPWCAARMVAELWVCLCYVSWELVWEHWEVATCWEVWAAWTVWTTLNAANLGSSLF